MSAFDDIIADGLVAAESAWGTTFTLGGYDGTYTGTFDRHLDQRSPSQGGLQFDDDATIVTSRQQFDVLLGITDESGVALLTEAEAAILIEGDTAVFPRVGQRLTHDARVYLITSREIDAHSITIRLKSVHR